MSERPPPVPGLTAITLGRSFGPTSSVSRPAFRHHSATLAAFNPAVKPSDIKLDQTYDNSYAQKALAKYKK